MGLFFLSGMVSHGIKMELMFNFFDIHMTIMMPLDEHTPLNSKANPFFSYSCTHKSKG